MSHKTYYRAVSIIFGFIGVVHVLRALQGWDAVIAGVDVPLWASWVSAVIAGYLSVRGWQFSKKSR